MSSGNTGHAEAVRIEFDPSQVSFKTLLTVFFGSHDPTTRNRQGNDVGTQYRSAIFYTTPEQKTLAEAFIADINASSKEGKSVVTEVVALGADGDASGFFPAESYHQDYYEQNKNNAYCEIVINPKLQKVVKEFGDLLQEESKKAIEI